jgi:pimeloyl-ACP methyl ester carboxylesterase
MSANSNPLEDLIGHQAEYLGTPEPKMTALRAEIAKVKALQPGQASGPNVLGAPPSYWLDLRGYNPAAMAKVLRCKLIVLHGQRDFQVTEQEYAEWQSALKGRPNATFHDYPGLNHFFMTGAGKGSPAEYAAPGHVAQVVVVDLGFWILGP